MNQTEQIMAFRLEYIELVKGRDFCFDKPIHVNISGDLYGIKISSEQFEENEECKKFKNSIKSLYNRVLEFAKEHNTDYRYVYNLMTDWHDDEELKPIVNKFIEMSVSLNELKKQQRDINSKITNKLSDILIQTGIDPDGGW